MTIADEQLRLYSSPWIQGVAESIGDDGYLGLVAKWFSYKQAAWLKLVEGGNTGILSFALPAPTEAGTPSSARPAGGGDYIDYDTGAVINTDAGWFSTAYTLLQPRENPVIHFRIRTGTDITNIRCWVGLFSATPMGSDDPAGLHLAGLRFSTGVPDSNWMFCTKDGTNLGTTDTLIAVAADTEYHFMLDISDPAAIRLGIAGEYITHRATNLPSTSGNLGIVSAVRNLAASARSIREAQIKIFLP